MNNECSICFEQCSKNNNKLTNFPCDNCTENSWYICKDCLSTIQKTSKKCPVCRGGIINTTINIRIDPIRIVNIRTRLYQHQTREIMFSILHQKIMYFFKYFTIFFSVLFISLLTCSKGDILYLKNSKNICESCYILSFIYSIITLIFIRLMENTYLNYPNFKLYLNIFFIGLSIIFIVSMISIGKNCIFDLNIFLVIFFFVFCTFCCTNS